MLYSKKTRRIIERKVSVVLLAIYVTRQLIRGRLLGNSPSTTNMPVTKALL
jgi:hypothetical protein